MKARRLHSLLQYIGVLYPKSGEGYLDRQRDALFSRLTLIGAAVIISKVIVSYFLYGFTPLFSVDFSILLSIMVSFLLFKNGRIVHSKILFLISLNFFVFVMCLLLPHERLIFVYFFLLMAISYSIFPDKDNGWKLSFVFLSSVLLAFLVLMDFKLTGIEQVTAYGSRESNRPLNVILSIVAIFFCIDFLIKNNHESETMLRSMANDIQKKNEDLQKINSELDRFVYSTSHDLRAPLLSIQGLVQLALLDCHDEKMKEYLSLIEERTDKLDDFIKEIIDYSRNARTELKPELTNMRMLITEVINNLRYITGADRIQFEIDFPENDTMLVDKSRIKIVLSNLISNAIKYHNPREEKKWVKILVVNEKNKCQIRVVDNGIGIKPEFQSRIFEMFFRATEKSTGSGLGLYIVKEILDKMEASIALASDYGKGSDFIITLPSYNENQ
jgi:signal transduction histidine kinase